MAERMAESVAGGTAESVVESMAERLCLDAPHARSMLFSYSFGICRAEGRLPRSSMKSDKTLTDR